MDKADFKKRVQEEEDYIRCPKFGNSLNRFLARNSDGVENATIARVLMISEEEVEKAFEEAVKLLREEMVQEE